MKAPRLCDHCHGEVPEDAPEGLCPKCLLRLGGIQLGLRIRQHATSAADCAPRQFGNYELLQRIGQGGMGTVYKARQLNLDRLVALKLLPFGASSGPGLVQRFRTEASAAAALQHPNIVAVHDVGEYEGQPFFSMDYVEGRTLAELVRDQPLPAKRAATYLRTIAEGVHYAHQHGIIHRDLKPSNVLIDAFDQPRITDFGLAKRLHGDSDLTLTGQVLGSPNFLSPEQAEGRSDAIGPASDIYSLGALLYHLLTRQPPFQADTLTTLLKQVLEADPVPPRSLNPSIPKDLETICLKCLEKEPACRYATAHALADDLVRFLRGESVWARPAGTAGKTWRWCRRQPVRASLIAALGLVMALGIAGISWQWRRAERERRTALSNERLASREAYASDIKMVQRSLEEGDLGQARRLLDKYRPKGVSNVQSSKPQADLRGWEWRYLWGLARGDEQYQLTRHTNRFANLTLAPDGRLLAIRDEGGNIHLWDLTLRQPVGLFTNWGHPRAMGFSPDGELFAFGTLDTSNKPVINFWLLSKAQIIRSLPQSSDVTALGFSPDGTKLATYQMEAAPRAPPRMRIWELPAGKLLKEFAASEPINGDMRIPLFSPDGKTLALGEMTGEIRLLELETDTMRVLPRFREGNGVNALAFSPDGRLLAAGYGYSDGPIRLWELATTNLVASLEGHRSYVTKLVFAPDGQRLYSASADQTIRIWDLAQKKQVDLLQGHTGEVTGLGFCPKTGMLVSCALDKTVLAWDPQPPRRQRPQDSVWGVGWAFGAQFTADSRRFITASLTNPVTIWNVGTADPIAQVPALGTNNKSLTLSLDERWLVVGGEDGALKVADLKTERLVKQWQPHHFPVIIAWFVRGGTALFSCGWIAHQQFEPKLWDTASWQEIRCPLEAKPTYGAALSRDHRLMAVAYGKEPMKIWDTVSGRVEALPGSEWAFGPGFSGDGRLLAAAFGSRVRVWEVSSRRELNSVDQPLNMLASAAFSPDDKRLVSSLANSGDIQPALRFWDYEIGRDLLSLHGHGAWTQRIEFSPDGNSVLATSYFGVADLWRAPSWAEIEAAEKKEGAGSVNRVPVRGIWVTNAPGHVQGEAADHGAPLVVCLSGPPGSPTAGLDPGELAPGLLDQVIASDDFEDGTLTGWLCWARDNSPHLRETNGCLTVYGYWPGRRGCQKCWAKGWRKTPLVSLADGQTLERRVDVVSMTESTTLVNLSLSGSNIRHGYTLSFGPHCLGLLKWMPGWSGFSCDRMNLPRSNVVLSLALSRVRTNLLVTGRVLTKNNPERVLFERTVVDTPGVEQTLTASEAQTGLGVSYTGWTKDVEGSPWFTFDYVDLEVIQENDGTKPEAAVVFDNFELRRYAAESHRANRVRDHESNQNGTN